MLLPELPGFGSLYEIALGGCPQAHQSVPALGQRRPAAQPYAALAAAPAPAAELQLSTIISWR